MKGASTQSSVQYTGIIERGYRRIGRESHREGWSGANQTLNVPFLLYNLSNLPEWPSSLG